MNDYLSFTLQACVRGYNPAMPVFLDLTSSLRNGRGVRIALASLLTLFPVLLLLKQSHANGMFTVLLLWGAVCLTAYTVYRNLEFQPLWKAIWPLVLALAAYPLALTATQWALGDPVIDLPYKYLRFALFFFIFLGLFRLGWQKLEWLQWGMVVAVLGAFVWMLATALSGRPSHVGVYNVIPFSNLTLLMGVMAALSLGWDPKRQWWTQSLKWLTLLSALAVSYLSETRGGWLALPVIAILALVCHRGLKTGTKISVLLALALSAYALGISSERVSARVASVTDNIAAYQEGERDTSAGIRLQLWSSAGRVALDQPWTGVGYKNYASHLQEQAQLGLITPAAASMPHAHNDLLYALAMAGLPGFFSLLLIYLVPLGFFLKFLNVSDSRMRCAARMGLMVPASFFMFGLTESMFDIAMTNAFYIVLLAFFSAYLLSRQQHLNALR